MPRAPDRPVGGSCACGAGSGLADLHLPLAELLGRRLGAGPRDDGLDRALQVVLLQAGVAGVEVEADRRAVGLVELVVEEVDDALEVVGAVARGRLVVVRAHDSPPSRPTVSRSLVRT